MKTPIRWAGSKKALLPILRSLWAAKVAGVGILEVGETSSEMIQQPLALSLAGVRPIDTSNFPRHFRQPLQHAYQTFRDGEPSKACSLVYDEVEAACRRLAIKAIKGKMYLTKAKVDKVPWASLLKDLDKNLSRSSAKTKGISSALISRMIGITSHRNDSGHKPKNQRELLRRDQALRTRFETAVDVLQELLDEARAFRL